MELSVVSSSSAHIRPCLTFILASIPSAVHACAWVRGAGGPRLRPAIGLVHSLIILNATAYAQHTTFARHHAYTRTRTLPGRRQPHQWLHHCPTTGMHFSLTAFLLWSFRDQRSFLLYYRSPPFSTYAWFYRRLFWFWDLARFSLHPGTARMPACLCAAHIPAIQPRWSAADHRYAVKDSGTLAVDAFLNASNSSSLITTIMRTRAHALGTSLPR